MTTFTHHRSPAHFVVAEAELPTAVWTDWSCVVRLVVTDPAALEPAAADLRAEMARVERAASRFVVESELCWANINNGRPVAVGPVMVDLVATALTAARRSRGAVDPTLGRDLVRLGYDRDISEVIGRTDTTAAEVSTGVGRGRRTKPDWRDVLLDPVDGRLTVPRGVALDLGATAKARTADRTAALLAERYGTSVLVEIGGDLAVAGPYRRWQVRVGERAEDSGEQISLHRGGVATSTTTIRTWPRAGRTVHHVIDPATGEPTSGRWRTVSVAAADCVDANTASTAALVLGERALSWLIEQRVAARLVDRHGRVVTVGGWPPVRALAGAGGTGPASW